MRRARVATAAVLLALCVAAAAAGDVAGDHWEGTWRVEPGAFAGTVVLRPSADARAPVCPGKTYTGGYSGRRSGAVAACGTELSLRGRLYEAGKRVGDISLAWELAVLPDGTVGAPTFRGTYSVAGQRGRLSATWLHHGGAIPKPQPSTGGATSPVARVEAMLHRNKAKCRLTWSSLTTRRSGKIWFVSANVSTFGHPSRATWEVVGTKIVPADQLAAEILVGCP